VGAGSLGRSGLHSAATAAVTVDPMGAGVDPDIADGIQKAAHALAAAGYEVVETDPPAVTETGHVFQYLTNSEIRTLVAPAIRPIIGAGARQALDLFCAAVPEPDIASYMGALAVRNLHARNWSQFLTQYDVVLGP